MGCDHRVTLLLLSLVVAPACRKSRPAPEGPAPVTSAPADRLAVGETPPGQEKAHDLVLPRGAHIERTFGKSVYAVVPLAPEAVASFVRAQSDDGETVVGPSGTVFPKLRVRNGSPDHWLRVEISTGERSDLTTVVVDRIEDVKPAPSATSNAELMKQVGLTPDGKLLDPTRIE